MLNSITLRNFKAFGTRTTIPLAPLTILSGPNNSGKSSLLHAILLLKQTDESDSTYPLCPVGRYGSFGSYRELAHNRSVSSINLGLNILLPQEIPVEFVKKIFKVRKTSKWNMPKLDMHVNLALAFNEDKENECGYKLGKSSFVLSIPGIEKRPSLTWNAKRLLQVKDLPSTITGKKFDGLPLHLLNFWPDHFEMRKDKYGIMGLPGIFATPLRRLNRYFQDINYLGPLRESPHRYYLLDKEFFEDLGPRGENTWNALAHSPVQDVSFFDVVSRKPRKMELLKAVNWWLRYCGIADQIKIKKRIGDPIYQIILKGNFKGDRTIIDLGFGVSQILPVLVMGLLGGSDTLQIFEQPEIHVHPAVQARLADFFIAIAQSRRQVIIETHSEHIINRIRTRILESSLKTEDVAILFLSKDKQHNSNFEKIRFRPDGQVANWPKGFFDANVDEIRAQNAALKKRLS